MDEGRLSNYGLNVVIIFLIPFLSQIFYYFMSQARSSEIQSQPLLSEQKRYPQVFRWKVAAIVITFLIAAFLVIDIILFVHYNNNQPRKINYTFLTNVLDSVAQNNPSFSAQAFANIATALSTSYGELWFQSASLVQAWSSASTFNLDTIGSFFDGDTENQLFFLTLTDGNNINYEAAAYSHIGFPLPSGEWQGFLSNPQPPNFYYTFEILDRNSVLMGGNSPNYLRMSGSTSNLLECTVLNLKRTTFTFLNLLSLDFSNAASVTANIDLTAPYSTCFDGEPSQTQVQNILKQILTDVTPLTLSKLEVFHLSQ